MSFMNLKLEELRKRLLEPVAATVGLNNSVYRHSSSELYPSEARPAQEIGGEEAAAKGASTEAITKSAATETKVPAAGPEPAKSVMSAVLQYVQKAAASSPDEGESMDQNSQYQLAQAVAKVFEQTKTFQERFAELNQMFEPIEKVGQAAARSFEPLKSFEGQLVQLARSFEPMRAFQLQLAQLAQTFEPMKGLQQQLAQLSEAFQLHLGRLTKSLDPAKEFQAELIKLARAFDPVADLQQQFGQLVETFKDGPVIARNGSSAAAATLSANIQH
jgi:hypothetical protein